MSRIGKTELALPGWHFCIYFWMSNSCQQIYSRYLSPPLGAFPFQQYKVCTLTIHLISYGYPKSRIIFGFTFRKKKKKRHYNRVQNHEDIPLCLNRPGMIIAVHGLRTGTFGRRSTNKPYFREGLSGNST